MSVTIRVSAETRDLINDISTKTNMSVDAVLTYLTGLNAKFDFFDVNWTKKLVEREVQEYLKDQDVEFRKKVELQKNQAVIKAQMMIFSEWLKIIEPHEKRTFLENVMGADRGGANFLERLANYQMFIVDGYKRLFSPDPEGYPQIPYVAKEDLIKCRRGFHIKNNRCDCRLWYECEEGSTAYENWLSVHGSPMEKKRYLEETTGQKMFERRAY